MLALSAMSYFDRTVLSIAAPAIMREFGISETAMGTLFSAFLVSYTALMTPGGALADRFGPRRVLGLATLGAAVTTGILAVPDPAAALIGIVPAFFCARLLFGAFTAPIYPSCARMVSNWVPPEQHARVQALILSGAGAGGALTPYTFSRLVDWLGWRAGFGVAGLATAILAVVWYWMARDRPAGGTARERKGAPVVIPLRRLLTDRNLALLTVGYFCLNYFEYIFFYWMYYYFAEIRHVSPSESVIYTTVMFVTMSLGIVGGGWISDWLARPLGLSRARRLLAVGAMVFERRATLPGRHINRRDTHGDFPQSRTRCRLHRGRPVLGRGHGHGGGKGGVRRRDPELRRQSGRYAGPRVHSHHCGASRLDLGALCRKRRGSPGRCRLGFHYGPGP